MDEALVTLKKKYDRERYILTEDNRRLISESDRVSWGRLGGQEGMLRAARLTSRWGTSCPADGLTDGSGRTSADATHFALPAGHGQRQADVAEPAAGGGAAGPGR